MSKNPSKHVDRPILVFPLRSPDQAFVMALCLIFSIPVLLGETAAPGSINSLLPEWLVILWSGILVIGSLSILGSYFSGDRIVGIIIEQFGSILIGFAAIVYSTAIFKFAFSNGGAISGTIVLGLAAARFYQAYQYQRFLNQVRTVLSDVEEGEPDGSQR